MGIRYFSWCKGNNMNFMSMIAKPSTPFNQMSTTCRSNKTDFHTNLPSRRKPFVKLLKIGLSVKNIGPSLVGMASRKDHCIFDFPIDNENFHHLAFSCCLFKIAIISDPMYSISVSRRYGCIGNESTVSQSLLATSKPTGDLRIHSKALCSCMGFS